MISDKNSLELKSIANAGGSLEVDGRAYNSLELRSVASSLTENATLKIHNSNSKNSLELSSIANAAPGKVIFA